jgi:alanyl-tRNA synthetase
MKRLFYENVYLREWETEIIEILEKDNKYLVKLLETAFYPEGGGQPSDKGLIEDIEVIEVMEANDEIYHVLETKPSNNKVHCKLNFQRRFDLMQQHSGQHLFSAVFFNKYKGETSSFHLGDDYVTVDISIGTDEVTADLVKDVENIANDYIFKDLNIITHVVTPKDIDNFPLRKRPPASEVIRIVEIEKTDFSPCCGTHVTKTGSIGAIKVIKTEKYKGLTRIYLKCGRRALEDFQNKTEIILELGKHLSVPENEILMRVKNEGQELKAVSRQLYEAKEKLSEYEALAIIREANSKVIIDNFEDKTFSDLQTLSKQLLLKGDFITILASKIDKKLILAHNGNVDLNFGKILKEQLKAFNGRGGGSPSLAQAAFDTTENMDNFIKFLSETINLL